MTRGYSLEQDLGLIINNPKYSDLEILCEDEKKLYACRAILAARSEVFDRLLYNGMKESYENKISFPTISSAGMEIILEYIYTGSIKNYLLTKDNIIESYYAADYFHLSDLQYFIMKTIKNISKKNYKENYSPELLSKVVEIMPLSEDNILLNLLVETVATIPLNTIEFDRLSITALQYLLSCTYEKEMTFATSEYEVFRYSAILAAKRVSEGSKVNYLLILLKPLGIIPAKVILSVYRLKALSDNLELSDVRGRSIYKFNYVWDESACGSNLIIEDNGQIVQAANNCDVHQNVGAKIALENKGIFEWDIIIEKTCDYAWIGVCASENFSYETFAGAQLTGWVLGSGGYFCNPKNSVYYCPSFHKDGTRITVHLDMNKRTCAFTINGTKCREVSEWKNLASNLYPVVSLKYPGRFRIQPHRKN
ncbi:uncharacterized protein OCT59_000996 [Rhizophagus irregularis]|uniref:uncharacterized protein n=1 Tax=Rhizophagus irregularis TaxID=588596 RepID=UPI003325D0D5|nr:hypothetical protein OCT59_000996 [Rhizophagus irregularis]